MIFVYGDSHAHYSFKGLPLAYEDRHQVSITMFRVGRDRQIIHYNPSEHDEFSVSFISYGEVDCRCHIHRQILAGREEDDVIRELSTAYVSTLASVLTTGMAVIVLAIIPPTRREEYESLNGPICHEFPFVGTDEERVRYTRKMNAEVERLCRPHSRIWFLSPYSAYTREDGTLRYECSDGSVHLRENTAFLSECIAWYHTVVEKRGLKDGSM
jgi:hypothetical protein